MNIRKAMIMIGFLPIILVSIMFLVVMISDDDEVGQSDFNTTAGMNLSKEV